MRVVFLALLGVAASGPPPPFRKQEVLCSESSFEAEGNSFESQEKGPLEFVEFLEAAHDDSTSARGRVVQ